MLQFIVIPSSSHVVHRLMTGKCALTIAVIEHLFMVCPHECAWMNASEVDAGNVFHNAMKGVHARPNRKASGESRSRNRCVRLKAAVNPRVS